MCHGHPTGLAAALGIAAEGKNPSLRHCRWRVHTGRASDAADRESMKGPCGQVWALLRRRVLSIRSEQGPVLRT